MFISVINGLLASKVIIPYFGLISFGRWGEFVYTPQFSPDILSYITKFFDTDQKRNTIITSIATFGFLPLLSPFSLILIFQDFAQRFVLFDPTSPLRQGLNLHYNANLAVLLFIGSVSAINNLLKNKIYQKLIYFHAFIIIIITIYYHQFLYHGPLGLIYNKDFFKITKNLKFFDDFISKVPRDGKIMVQNNLAVRFTHNNLYLLLSREHLENIDPDIVVLDFRPGQNPNNYWPMTETTMETMAKSLQNNPKYNIIYRENHRFIFQKKRI
jgi:hypothetical protein